MQQVNQQFFDKLHDGLKTGDDKRPVVRVEVDRLVFIPGEIEEFTFEKIIEEQYTETIEISTINETTENVYEGTTTANDAKITFPIQGETLQSAANSGRITSRYGNRKDPFTGKTKFHTGVDFGYAEATPVVAAWGGRVIYAGDKGDGHGYKVQILHNFLGSQNVTPLKTTYSHLLQYIPVKVGQVVSAGQKIGEVGSTGKSTGNHLHFEIMENADANNGFISYGKMSGKFVDTKGKIIEEANFHNYFNKGKTVDPMDYLQSLKVVSRSFSTTGTGVVSSTYSSSSKQRIFYSNLEEVKLFDSWFKSEPVGYDKDKNEVKITINTPSDWALSIKAKLQQQPTDYSLYGTVGTALNELIAQNIQLDADTYKARAEYYKKLITGNRTIALGKMLDYSQSSGVLEQPPSSASISFDVDTEDNPAMLSIYAGFITGSSESTHDDLGNKIRIFADGKLVVNHLLPFTVCNSFRNFSGTLPKGTKKAKIEFISGGKFSVRWDILNIVVDKLLPIAEYTNTDEQVSLKEITKNRYVTKKTDVKIPFGSFKFLDTLTLDNIISVSLDSQYELYANQATITLSNPNGYYSPYFNSYWFPELGTTSPFSYELNGTNVSVLTENTPIRIYMGYGEDLIRVFTGFIDKTDVQSEGTITITARDVCKILIEKVLLVDKKYPDETRDPKDSKGNLPYWTKSAIVQDLMSETRAIQTVKLDKNGNKEVTESWREDSADKDYPDAVIEETYFKQNIKDSKTGKYKYIKAVPGKEGEFAVKDFSESVKLDAEKSLNPFVEEKGKKFIAYSIKIIDAIADIIKDTGLRIYADRYGTIRLEKINLRKPITYVYTESENLISLNQTIDFSRGRSHIIVKDKRGNVEHFKDDEIFTELKGELRTLFIYSEWADTAALKKMVAKYAFFDMKRLCRTIQVTIPLNPLLDPLDRIWVVNSRTSTRSVYIIKGIKTTFSADGATQTLDLMWSADEGELDDV